MKTHDTYYISPCGRFHGCREDYTEEEWEEILAGDNVIIPVGTPLESAIYLLTDAGLCREEIEEILTFNVNQTK